MSELITIDGFAGPGGWDVAAARLGLSPVVGIELDAAACATRAAAGHLTIRADISRYPAEALAGKVSGSAFSPVCTTFSSAGKRGGVAILDVLGASIRDTFECFRELAAHARGSAKGAAKLTDEKVREIRALLAHGVPGKDIATHYGIGQATVSAIKHGRTWTHVTDEPPLLAEHVLAMAAGISRAERAA
jgi:hypothetical protein